MVTCQPDAEGIQELIKKYRTADAILTEADVAEVFVARLFAALGWDTLDPLVWNRQSYVRGAGYADAALHVQHRPVLFVEVKRFGRIAHPQEEISIQQTLFGDAPILSQAERAEQGIDRTPEEKQAMRYARAAGIRWAVLTNFERLILFDADEERVVLAFDMPEEYLDRLEDLALLAPADTPEQFASRMQWYASVQKKPEIDDDFYRFLSDWRLRLAQTIYDHNWKGETLPEAGEKSYAHLPEPPLTAVPGKGAPPRHLLRAPDGSLDVDHLRQAVQRTLDRLIILRYADDVGFLDQHDLLEGQLVGFLNRRVYAVEYEFQQDLNRLYAAFYRRHDTNLFAPEHVCEQVRIPNDTLVDLVRAVSGISFRKFSSDILGNTYESYLGQRLVLEEETIRAETDRALRKSGGIYYTPSYIVRYIVDHTLGRWLYGTVDGRPDGEPLPDASRKTLSDLKGLRVLDPAMGSGSFLIYAFEVLADFYERENERITRENAARWDAWGQQAMKEGMFGQNNEVPQTEETAPDYVSRILQEHLYGVDLDPEAVEIAGVNLILRAFDRLRGKRERKLPLILGQNLKVGNSLISGVTGPDDLAPFEDQRRRLVALRRELATLEDDTARAEKVAEIKAVAAPVDVALNKPLTAYFDDVAAKQPFNWESEFPEVFDPDLPEGKQGFTIVVGNPPYVRIQFLDEDARNHFSERFVSAFGKYDLYYLFAELAVHLLAVDGLHGYIIPTKFMEIHAGEKLRTLIAKDMLIEEIVDFGDLQAFPDATNYVCIFVGSKRSTQNESHHNMTYIALRSLPEPGEPLSPHIGRNALVREIDQSKLDSGFWMLKPSGEFDVSSEDAKHLATLGNICQAIAKGIDPGGATDIFVMTQIRARRRGIEADVIRPILGGSHVQKWTRGSDQVILFPYRADEDRFQVVDLWDYPRATDYLEQHKETLASREYVISAGKRWYEIWNQRTPQTQLVPKLVTCNMAQNNQFAFDENGDFLTLHTVYSIILKDASHENYLFLLALLNSSLLTYLFRRRSTYVRDRYYRYNKIYLRQLPIRVIDSSNPADVAAHDGLVALAQRMLDLNKVRQAVTGGFAATLRGYERTPTPLRLFLNEHRDFITRHALLDANEEGEVNGIAVDEQGQPSGLLIRAQVEGAWRDVVRLDVEDEGLRLYLLLALRAFLDENRRKRVWSRGKILNGVLGALEVPRLNAATPKAHQQRVAEVLADVRHLLPTDLPHHDVGLDRHRAPFHLSGIETDLAATDAEIDRCVYDLYSLSEEERRIVEESLRAQ